MFSDNFSQPFPLLLHPFEELVGALLQLARPYFEPKEEKKSLRSHAAMALAMEEKAKSAHSNACSQKGYPAKASMAFS